MSLRRQCGGSSRAVKPPGGARRCAAAGAVPRGRAGFSPLIGRITVNGG